MSDREQTAHEHDYGERYTALVGRKLVWRQDCRDPECPAFAVTQKAREEEEDRG